MKYNYHIYDGIYKKHWKWNIFSAISYFYYLKKKGIVPKIKVDKNGFHVIICG